MKKQEILMSLVSMLINDNNSEKELTSCENINNNEIYNDIIGKYCIIRTYSAGIYFGKIENVENEKALVTDAFIIHSWSGDKTKTTLDLSKFEPNKSLSTSVFVEKIYLTNCVAIIPCTKEMTKYYISLDKNGVKR